MTEAFDRILDKLENWGAEPRQVLEETFMNDTDFYQTCLVKFSKETFLQSLRESLVPEKKEIAIRAVHTMKGNADYLGLFPVMDAAMTVLTDLRADNLARAAADMPELENVFAAFCALINSSIE